VSCKAMALSVLMLTACTVVSTADQQWEWPHDINRIE